MRARRLAPVLAAGLLVAAGCGGASRKSAPRRYGVAAPGPGCSTAVTAAPTLSVHTALEQVAESPFGITVTPDGRWSFLDLVGGQVEVFSDTGFTPRLVRTINVPDGGAVGSSLTRGALDDCVRLAFPHRAMTTFTAPVSAARSKTS